MSRKSSTIRKIAFYIIVLLSVIVILASLLSLIYDIPKWYLKALDFPRLQQLVAAFILLFAFVILNRKWKTASVALLLGLCSSVLIHSIYMFPYALGSEVVFSKEITEKDYPNTVSILLGNVLMTNKNSDAFLKIVEKSKPDMVLTMEVNDWWIENLEGLEKEYPYSMKHSLDNAYGMALHSKLPLKNTEINFLNHSKVPSFTAIITLPSGKEFKFYGVHPVAPFPSDKYPTNIGKPHENGKQEIAIQKIGKSVMEDTLPVIVAGDFNDVSWSNTTRLFGKNCDIKDVRIGRGLHNTFDATSSFMRWPLDHFFVSNEWSVVEFERLESFDSDHFPLFGKFFVE